MQKTWYKCKLEHRKNKENCLLSSFLHFLIPSIQSTLCNFRSLLNVEASYKKKNSNSINWKTELKKGKKTEMGLKNGAEEENCSMNEALLFATMCIIGLPVDVHLKDGSVYSGIFHTASVEKEFGIVLKKAKLTKKGRCATNVANGSVVETLVILAGDLVQVVAKGVPLPFDGFSGNIAHGNGEAAFQIQPSSANPLNGAKKFNKFTMDKRKSYRKRNSFQNENGFADGFIPTKAGKEHEGQNPMGNSKGVEYQKQDDTNIEQDECDRKFDFHVEEGAKEVQHSVSSRESSALDTFKPVDACLTQVKPDEEGNTEMTTKLLLSGAPHDTPMDGKLDNQCCEKPTATEIYQDAVCSGVSTSTSPVTDVPSESCQSSFATPTAIVPPQSSESNKNYKEFKLNPGAKIFSPSYASAISAAPPIVPAVANVSYIPGNSPMVALAGSQPDVEISTFAPRTSASSKFVSYGNVTAATGVSGSQFSQPIVGQMGSRTQPLRYAGQYHPVQAAPAYLTPNSQAVMFGRLGQLICVPVSHDLVQGAAAISPVPARPPLTPHHVQLPKHQGSAPGQALQLCVPQPFIAGGQQPLAVPSHVPYMQPPFPANRPIQVPGSSGLFSTKLP
ncbi:polyadenylate-binding protein-interacting protein 4 isoform X2 [Durio zibethinus]|uniref:Polyadenylate-binding protein-interacting protein 4 isoform X2 n=1 Tax=Durio zibethinus TaxID=66656 RepID=A0A6P5WM11_DURZI|nr:polyadenylate-binding protein-interacting protein 4 isoform X2 [Durio zibethinus]